MLIYIIIGTKDYQIVWHVIYLCINNLDKNGVIDLCKAIKRRP